MMQSKTGRAIGCAALALLTLAACEQVPPPPAPVVMPCDCGYMVFFDFDSAAITRQTAETIGGLARNHGRSPFRVRITGHTDRAGSSEYNIALSLRRANAVRDALVREGVPAERISILGRGALNPLVPTKNGVREGQNRRVEMLVY